MSAWNLIIKDALPSLGFYLIYIAVVALLEKLDPTGMCTPGVGMVLVLLLPLFSVTLLLKNAFQVFIFHQPQRTAMLLHLLACIGIWVAFYSLQPLIPRVP
jgi:hypothetical protein